ncbi:MAG: hypothetical protein RBU45_12625 [Myxococcota bacterium]|jgi:tetratricopeptide (TPR) repeat protein|nr:hypothetical protein [Myxococcota bacterium]
MSESTTDTGNPVQEALDAARRETEAARGLTADPDGLATCLLHQSGYAAVAGEIAESRACLEEARGIYQGLGRFPEVARCLLLLARLARSEKAPQKAQEQLDLSLWLFRQLGDVGGQAEVLLEAGEMALAEERLDRAEDWFLQAQRRFHEAGQTRREIDALKAAALARQFAGSFIHALRLFEEALGLARELPDPAQVLEITLALGGLQTQVGERRQARLLLQEARELARQQEAPDKEVLALTHLATLEASLDRLKEAEQLADEARRLAAEAVDVPGYLLAVVVLTQVHQAAGDDVACLEVLFRASNGLADLLGEPGRQPMQELLTTLRKAWGEERYTRSLKRYIAIRQAASQLS